MILNNNDTVFGLPIMSTSRETIEKYFNNPPYQFYTLQHRYNNNNNTYFNEYIKIDNRFISKGYLETIKKNIKEKF